jgi:isoleucyl-tRNA synthetase
MAWRGFCLGPPLFFCIILSIMDLTQWVQIEKKIVNFWKSARIFEKLLEKNRKNRRFVYYEGPPYANDKPHMGHFLTRTFKDTILRFRGFLGDFVERKAGWDTHGLPIEVATEKELGFKTKKDILNFGIANFNQKCKELVTKFKDVWEKMDERMGFWIDHKNAYITFDPFYMESCWWIVKQIYQKNFLKEEYGVVAYCPRCETILSKAELGMPDAYKKVKDPSIYVKLKLQNKDEYILIWTTTPWTLPGNLAVAVNPNEKYYLFETEHGKIWSHKNLSEKIISEKRGEELSGLSYELIFKPLKEVSSNCFRIYPAEFVDVSEGSGFVHIAPAYGEEDFNLGKKVGLDLVDYLDDQGKFRSGVFEPLNEKLEGLFFKEGDKIIFQFLKERGVLYEGDLNIYEHDYPHCWRCKTPLIYQARNSWVIKASLIRDELLKENEKVNWYPKEIGEGRFGSWLKEGRDWHVSRKRFWGIPLPIWQCNKCGRKEVIGSLKELAKHFKSKNTYYLMRHGEAISNVRKIISSYPETFFNPLTPKGLNDIKKVVPKLKKLKIDLIVSSPILRAKETAWHIAEALNVEVEIDERLREIDFGVLNNKKEEDYHRLVSSQLGQYEIKPEGGENLREVKERMFKVILDLEQRFENKNILIVSHGDPLWALAGEMLALSERETANNKELYFKLGEVKKIDYLIVPRDEKNQINLHRPYVDQFVWKCKCGGEMRRIEDILDIWFDSGAVPFASFHYPFENKKEIDKNELYPADIIAEGVDQTRGWFYTLLVVGYLIKKKAPYKNVLVNGLVLDEKGIKMSKSLGNVVDPIVSMEKYGADLMRFYLIRVNDPWLNKSFSEKELMAVWNNTLGLLHNIYRFYRFYYHKDKNKTKRPQKWELDLWFEARLKETKSSYLEQLENYQLTKAARLLEDLISDLSRWWIRRSRDRFQKIYGKSYSRAERNNSKFNLSGLRLLENYLFEIILLLAPIAPFTSEYIYQELKHELFKNPKESIHLFEFKKPAKLTKREKLLLENMKLVREIASEVSRIRKENNIRLRQPLMRLYLEAKLSKDLAKLLKEEINVKEIVFGKPRKEGRYAEFNYPVNGWLDLALSEDLIHEGVLNDVIRYIQALRQEANLTPSKLVKLKVEGDYAFQKFIKTNKKLVFAETNTILSPSPIKKLLAEKEIDLKPHFERAKILIFV